MQASIISIGDELLVGQVVNTNASFIATQLNNIGIYVKSVITVGDEEEDILNAFKESFSKNDLVIVTGGLGPTHDDITKKAVCKFFDVKLKKDEAVRENIKRILSYRNIPWNNAAEEQTSVPEGCKIIDNNLGTAAGFLFERNNKFFIVLPGVPYEMQNMMTNYVIPFLSSHIVGEQIVHKTLRTTGITEAALSELIGPVNKILLNDAMIKSTLAFLPSPLGVNLRISVKGLDKNSASERLLQIEKALREKIDYYVYGIDDEEMEIIVGRMLMQKMLTLAIAESCTGGLISHRITNVPGSSNYFERGVVTYSNRSKVELLEVSENLIREFGAVSEQVAKAMANGVRKISGTSIGISTTGIAGPTGATEKKPVGLVWIGYSDEKETFAIENYFGSERNLVKIRASQAALNLIRLKLSGKEIR